MAANLHVAFLCLKGRQNKKSGWIFCVRQVYFTSKSWRRIWWRVNQPFKHTFSHHVSGKQYTDLGQNLFFFALFKLIILQFFTILQDKLHSFNIQDDRSSRRLPLHNKLVALITLYSRLPITRTFKGNQKRFEFSGVRRK